MAALLPLATRDFVLLLDPHYLPDLITAPGRGGIDLIAALRNLEPPVRIHLVFPVYLAGAEHLEAAQEVAEVLDLLDDDAEVPRSS